MNDTLFFCIIKFDAYVNEVVHMCLSKLTLVSYVAAFESASAVLTTPLHSICPT